MSEEAQGDYDKAKEALTQRFEPPSKKELYNAELQVRTKRPNEGWADFAEELRRLTEKAFPELDAKGVEQMALTHYLGRLSNPQVAFAVKQQRPKTVEEAVRATLEVESYMVKPAMVGSLNLDVNEFTVGAIGSSGGDMARMPQSSEQTLTQAIEQLSQRMSQLEMGISQQGINRPDYSHNRKPLNQHQHRDQVPSVICYRCGKEGHYARGCTLRHPFRQGN